MRDRKWRKRVTTSVIRMETQIPGAYFDPLTNPRYLYGWITIDYIYDGHGIRNRRHLYRFNFSLGRVEAVPF